MPEYYKSEIILAQPTRVQGVHVTESAYVRVLLNLFNKASVKYELEVGGYYDFLPPYRSGATTPRIDIIAFVNGSIIGIECKAPTMKKGDAVMRMNMAKAISQAFDYQNFARFILQDGRNVALDYCLIAPLERPYGAVESIMVHNHIGTLTHYRYGCVSAKTGGMTLFEIDGQGRLTGDGKCNAGTKNGSR
jgi:hypothetical protein